MLLRSNKKFATDEPLDEPPNKYEMMKCRNVAEVHALRKRRNAFEAQLDECLAKYTSAGNTFDNWIVYIRERFGIFIANFPDIWVFDDTNVRSVSLYVKTRNETNDVREEFAKRYARMNKTDRQDPTKIAEFKKLQFVVKTLENLFKND